ncbi:MAG: hypothetical protein ACYS18_10820 [Planctomycetota bacterium]|jgi:hypothetical protein
MKVICESWLDGQIAVQGGLDGDANVNFLDFAQFADYWQNP